MLSAKNFSIFLAVSAVAAGLMLAGVPEAAAGVPDGKAKVISLLGHPEVLKKGGGSPAKCRLNMILKSGDKVTTGEDGFVAFTLLPDEADIVKVNPASEVVLDLGGQGETIRLIDGELLALLEGDREGKTFEVVTPSAVCGARGTGWYEKASGDVTEVYVFENTVHVRGLDGSGAPAGDEIFVDEGYKTFVRKGERPSLPEKADPAMLEELSGEMYMLLKVRKGGMMQERSSLQSEKRMAAMESRVERAEHRMDRVVGVGGQSMPMMKDVGGGRDDDRTGKDRK